MKQYFRNRYKSFKYAFAGLKLFFSQVNFRIHQLAAVLVIALSLFLELTQVEWLFVASSIFSVIIAEAINTVVEKSMDKITKSYDLEIKSIKDMSAAFVLLCAIYSIVIGAIIFIPKILELF
jgi:diacylglycerol kinase